jgi:RNA polymerase sigma-70 factor (ECF subfamily)
MTNNDDAINSQVERAQRGDRAAFAALYALFAERLYRFTRSRVANAQDAEDIVQQVFLKMIEALPRYRQRGTPFAAWLFRLARNTVIDHGRTRHPTETLEPHTERATLDAGPEALAMVAVQMMTVESALRGLTPEQQEVIALRFFAGLGPAEIGHVMGKREGSVRALQFRALSALRRELAPPPDESARQAGELGT